MQRSEEASGAQSIAEDGSLTLEDKWQDVVNVFDNATMAIVQVAVRRLRNKVNKVYCAFYSFFFYRKFYYSSLFYYLFIINLK